MISKLSRYLRTILDSPKAAWTTFSFLLFMSIFSAPYFLWLLLCLNPDGCSNCLIKILSKSSWRIHQTQVGLFTAKPWVCDGSRNNLGALPHTQNSTESVFLIQHVLICFFQVYFSLLLSQCSALDLTHMRAILYTKMEWLISPIHMFNPLTSIW